MEPRFFNHGDHVDTVFSIPPKDIFCFNGATVFQPWRHYDKQEYLSDTPYAFQWSHGFSTMETCDIWGCCELGGMVSMEPRFFNHGDAYYLSWRRGAILFQWSHGFSTMETPLDFYAYLAGLRGAISSTSWPPYKNYAILEPHRELHLA